MLLSFGMCEKTNYLLSFSICLQWCHWVGQVLQQGPHYKADPASLLSFEA